MKTNLKYMEGNLITLAQTGQFDAIAHGCNCFCRMGRGIAPLMAKAFGCNRFPKEGKEFVGQKEKLGTIDYQYVNVSNNKSVAIINAYSQYHWLQPSSYGFPLDYDALQACFEKINQEFKGKVVGIPKIGAGLAGGDWQKIEAILLQTCIDLQTLVVVELPSNN